LRTGAVDVVTDAACRDEWIAVLAYPRLALDASRRDAAVAAFDAQLHLLPEMERKPASATSKLPRCADPDDQKFLELAQACGAQWLLSRDNALLKLARRTRRDHGFDIATPQEWSRVYAGLAGASSANPV
jgi:predicted nucleic acid-binding protein